MTGDFEYGAELDRIVERFHEIRGELESWSKVVRQCLEGDPVLLDGIRPLYRDRVKSAESLRNKCESLNRQRDPESVITADNLLSEITDLCGVRLIVASKNELEVAHRRIHQHAEWDVDDESRAYAWFPAEVVALESAGRDPLEKASGYCSRHYVLVRKSVGTQPYLADRFRCELQVRTMLEEAFWENEHRLRYKGCHHEVLAGVLKQLAYTMEVHDHTIAYAYEWSAALSAREV
jgi:ppGpp synthetase/RelA/SpoT-type nucleotidyltranferase